MSDYKGALYIGTDAIHLWDGSLIVKDEVTTLLSEEAAINDNLFEPVYKDLVKKPVVKEVEKVKKKGVKK